MAGTASDVQSQCRKMVFERAPEITQALIDKALEGSQQQAKFLFDFAFAAAPKAAEDDDDIPGPSFAQILVERLRELEEENAEDSIGAAEAGGNSAPDERRQNLYDGVE